MPKHRDMRLGRGLAALLGDVASPQNPEGLVVSMLPLDVLRPGTFQPRMTMPEGDLEELAASIKTNGVLQPILVRTDRKLQDEYEIIAGERRWRAAQIAGLHEIPCLIRSMSDSHALAAGLVENLQRLDLNAIDEAGGYRRLSDEFDLTQEDLAKVVGKSRSHVANVMRLLSLPEEILSEVRKGTLSAGHARALLSNPEPLSAAADVIKRGLNVRQTEALPRSKAQSASGAADGESETTRLQHELSERLGLQVKISHGTGGGYLRINYRSVEQLESLVTLIRGNRLLES